MRAAIPNLLLGNAIVLKHAENVIGCGIALQEIIDQATQLEVFQQIVIDLSLSEFIIKHPSIAAVTLTGSNRAGAIVAKQAGEVCKKCVLELGGSDAYIIRYDTDIDSTAKQIVLVRMSNTGQVCISPKRLIVDHSIKAQFEQAIVKYVKLLNVGDPLQSNTTMGPMARKDLRDNLHQQVQSTIAQGAQCLTGGKILDNNQGFYYQPTVLTNVTDEMTAFKEELFGPVISITESSTDEHAIDLANCSQFGLGSGIFTKDIQLAKSIARYKIEAGMCFINQCVASHRALPFGGVKQSGYGRECATEALRELANVKTILIGE